MSIADIFPRRRRPVQIIDEQGPRVFKLPDDLEQNLAAAMDDYSGTRRVRTAQVISDEIAHLRIELTNARELVAQGEAKEAELVAELKAKIDDEIAAKKAAHEAEVAELEGLRPPAAEEPVS